MATARSEPLTDAEADALFASLGRFAALVLAVSGGADSTALMHLAHSWNRRRGRADNGLVAVTINHGLRLQSAEEAAEVGRQAAQLGIEHRIVTWAGDKPQTGLQAAARAFRYCELAKVAHEIGGASIGPVAIVTAHTADDQAETVIMRLARGSGVDGLAAIPSQGFVAVPDEAGNPKRYPVLRPLLDIRHAQLVATLHARGVSFFDDPTNRDRRFERARVREVLGTLEELGLSSEALLRTASRMQVARGALERAADDLETRAVTTMLGIVHEIDRDVFVDAPAETAVRMLRRVLDFAGGQAPAAELSAVEDAARRIASTGHSRVGFTLGGCVVESSRGAVAQRELIRVYREPDRDGGLPHLNVRPGQRILWDKRFWAEVHESHPEVVEIGPLGDDWGSLRVAHPSLAELSVPAAAARGIPAFRTGGRIVAVPLLAAFARSVGDQAGASALAGASRIGATCAEQPNAASLRLDAVAREGLRSRRGIPLD